MQSLEADAEAAGNHAKVEEASVDDVEGLRDDGEASVATQRLAQLTQGQEAAPEEFLWDRLSTGEPRRVTQSL